MVMLPQPRTPAPARQPGTYRLGARVNWTVVTLVSLAIASYFVGQYAAGSLDTLADRSVGLASTYANRPLPVQVAFYAHISFAGLALAVGPFQFAAALRDRHPAVHRTIGRIFLVSVAIGAPAALVMACFSSIAFDGFFGFGSLAVLWGFTAYRGYRAIRRRDIPDHRAWMIRCFALTFAACTLRLWLAALIAMQLTVDPDRTQQQAFTTAYYVVPFLCWLPNIVVAEIMIRRRDLPGLRFTRPPTAPPPDPATRPLPDPADALPR